MEVWRRSQGLARCCFFHLIRQSSFFLDFNPDNCDSSLRAFPATTNININYNIKLCNINYSITLTMVKVITDFDLC